ncbi:M48 family metallopeptidase [Microbaculum marinum]|uniref:M48 family metallopeptidase n=1 Tax=Microbaculum marinum TaxID=1764581 RepID=A0AAW9RWT4_9HYPH
MFRRARKIDIPEAVEIAVDGRPVRIAVRHSSRASRYTLRVQNATGEPLLVIPAHGNLDRAMAFARSQAGWLRERLRRMPERVPFADGCEILLRGDPHLLRHTGRSRGTVELAASPLPGMLPEIRVSGGPEHMSRRLVDWLKAEARRDLELSVQVHTAKLGVRAKRITVRDQTSRWGSCSTSGTLSFSWRLVLAPPFVLDYLAAHEVAHLVEMNHSARFWKTLERICPQTRQAEAWLKANGTSLFRYGPR